MRQKGREREITYRNKERYGEAERKRIQTKGRERKRNREK